MGGARGSAGIAILLARWCAVPPRARARNRPSRPPRHGRSIPFLSSRSEALRTGSRSSRGVESAGRGAAPVRASSRVSPPAPRPTPRTCGSSGADGLRGRPTGRRTGSDSPEVVGGVSSTTKCEIGAVQAEASRSRSLRRVRGASAPSLRRGPRPCVSGGGVRDDLDVFRLWRRATRERADQRA